MHLSLFCCRRVVFTIPLFTYLEYPRLFIPKVTTVIKASVTGNARILLSPKLSETHIHTIMVHGCDFFMSRYIYIYTHFGDKKKKKRQTNKQFLINIKENEKNVN